MTNKKVTCKCGCTWFERVHIAEYDDCCMTPLILGQAPVHFDGRDPFYFLKCVKCGSLTKPNITLASTDPLTDLYYRFEKEVVMINKTDRPNRSLSITGEEL